MDMMQVKEVLTGKVTYKEDARELVLGARQALSLANLEEAALCSDTKLKLGNKAVNKGLPGEVLCLRLREAASQPGRMSLSKSRNLALYCSDPEGVACLMGLLRTWENPGRTPFDGEDGGAFPVGKCVVEAKRGCSDYTRAGNAGANPYGKAGVVSAVVLPEVEPAAGTAAFQYLGTTSRFHDSEYFSANPQITFDLRCAAVEPEYCLEMTGSGCVAKAVFRRWDIERDETASGIWYVSFEKIFSDICEAAAWLRALHGNQRVDLPGEERACPAPDTARRVGAQELLDMIEALADAGILTEEERLAKAALVKERFRPDPETTEPAAK